jgi:hypothetical protein
MTNFEVGSVIVLGSLMVGLAVGVLLVVLLPIMRQMMDRPANRLFLTISEILRQPKETSVIGRDSSGRLTVERDGKLDGRDSPA